MTLAQLAVTVALIGVLGLVVSRFGLSGIPAYLLAGLLLGPHEPKELSLIRPSEVTDFLAELGIVFLLSSEPVSGAQPQDVIERGDTLVAVGKARQFAAFRKMLAEG
jgi:CPA2 family monovalent cation:H+ antiporter-2